MISLLIIIAITATSLHFTDMESSSAFYGIFLPLINFLCFVALALWLVLHMHKKGINQHTSSSDSGGGGFFGGDGGSGDC